MKSRFASSFVVSFAWSALLVLLLTGNRLPAQVITPQYGGPYANWPTSWNVIPGIDDGDDGALERLDFVGNSSYPGGYWAADDSYVYFRVRVDEGGATTWRDTVAVLIDKTGDGALDYAFAWDSKADNHGLELCVLGGSGTRWDQVSLDDLDGNGGIKISPPDFGASNGDGYLRTVDGQSAGAFGTTTFIDFAAKWSYLGVQTTLAPGQTWKVQFGSIENATDHSNFRADVAANSNPSTVGLAWSGGISPVPEPAGAIWLLALAGLMPVLARRGRRGRRPSSAA